MAKAVDIKALDARRKLLDKYLTNCKGKKAGKGCSGK